MGMGPTVVYKEIQYLLSEKAANSGWWTGI